MLHMQVQPRDRILHLEYKKKTVSKVLFEHCWAVHIPSLDNRAWANNVAHGQTAALGAVSTGSTICVPLSIYFEHNIIWFSA